MNESWERADQTVRQVRQEVMRAVSEAQTAALNPLRRARAEERLKSVLLSLREPVSQARRDYEIAQQQHFSKAAANDQYVTRMVSGEGVPAEIVHERAMSEQAAARAAALESYSTALECASWKETPFLAGVNQSLRERLPEQTKTIMSTRPGRLTAEASVEEALKLTPNDPDRWDPTVSDDIERGSQYLRRLVQLDKLNQETEHSRAPGQGRRGAALATASYAAMSDQQRGVSQAWTNTARSGRAAVDSQQGLNSVEAEDFASRNGVPAMPAVSAQAEPGQVLEGQAMMLKEAHGHERKTGTVPIYSAPTAAEAQVAPSTSGIDR